MILAGVLTREVTNYLGSRDTVLVPAGSFEQHADAAPLACDTIIPAKLCAAAGMKTGTAVTPAITFGMSESHMGFPGTVSLRPATLSALARDISVSLYTHGFRKIIFLSGHGGNRSPISDGLRKASEDCPEAARSCGKAAEAVLPGSGISRHGYRSFDGMASSWDEDAGVRES